MCNSSIVYILRFIADFYNPLLLFIYEWVNVCVNMWSVDVLLQKKFIVHGAMTVKAFLYSKIIV